MKDFTFLSSTKVIFGRGSADDVGAEIQAYSPKKVLIHYGGGSAIRSGLLGKVTSSLDKHGIAHIELGGVEPNPKVGLVREAVALCKKEGVDFIIAVGGGSVIDSAKCTAFSVANDADPWDIVTGTVPAKAILPLAVIPTIAAAGSETSNSHVISNPEIPFKKGLNNEMARPKIAFMDPQNTFTVSKYQTGCGIVDIMMHTFERYYTSDPDTELTDRLAEALLLSVKNAGYIAVREPENYEARATLMWASSLSHNGLMGCGKKYKCFPAHRMEHSISALFDSVAHGAGLSVLYPAWAKYVYKYDVRRFCQTAVRIWGIPMNFEHPERTAMAGIETMRHYFKSIGMPVKLSELGVGPDAYEAIASNATNGDTVPVASYIPLGNAEIMDIFKLTEE